MTSAVEPRRASQPKTPVVRVAIYCRKSVEKGGEQALTSIDAQRGMVESYVASQAGAGWTALPERFDDTGVSGATLARPAFRRLMALVQAKGVDVIAVYKLDRVSRSMLDFLQLQQECEKVGVQFVSISERLDTTTAMGRFGIQLIMAVAQLERGTTSERVRDKVAAAREGGLWTGGTPPLGYDSVQSRLVVNEPEARVVRDIFALYLRLGSPGAMISEVAARGWTNKRWTNGRGEVVGGSPFDKNSLRRTLTNVLYVGRIRSGESVHHAQHSPIIDEPTWDAVQTMLAAAKPEKPRRRRQSWSSLLGGLLQCGCGAGMSHHFSARGNKRWSYYVCARHYRQSAAACPGSRVRMDEMDSFVVERLRVLGRDRALVAATVEAARQEEAALDEGELRRVLAELMPLWDVMQLRERQRVVNLLLERVTYTAATHEIQFALRDSGVRTLGRELSKEATS